MYGQGVKFKKIYIKPFIHEVLFMNKNSTKLFKVN